MYKDTLLILKFNWALLKWTNSVNKVFLKIQLRVVSIGERTQRVYIFTTVKVYSV